MLNVKKFLLLLLLISGVILNVWNFRGWLASRFQRQGGQGSKVTTQKSKTTKSKAMQNIAKTEVASMKEHRSPLNFPEQQSEKEPGGASTPKQEPPDTTKSVKLVEQVDDRAPDKSAPTNQKKSVDSQEPKDQQIIVIETKEGLLHLLAPPRVTRTIKIAFNPTMEEMRQLDRIHAELKKPFLSSQRRTALLTEKEKIVQQAQRPTVYLGASVVSRECPPDHSLIIEQLTEIAKQYGTYEEVDETGN